MLSDLLLKLKKKKYIYIYDGILLKKFIIYFKIIIKINQIKFRSGAFSCELSVLNV